MPAKGRPWNRERAAFKAECAKQNAPCWICRNTKGPIDYQSKFDPEKPNPLLFSVDHTQPTSLGGDAVRRANFKPAHYGCNSSRGNGRRGEFPSTVKW